jgi:type I restriction enzyme S subunit
MVSGKMIGLRPKREAVIPRILAYALSTAVAQQFLDHRTTGMAESQVNFTNNTLLSTPVELPPMDEQLVVMAILDAVDTATRYTEQIVFKLQAMMAGLVHDLLTRGVDDNGEIRDPKGHPGDFGESPLGTFPLSWQMTRLENVTEGITAPICYGIVQAGSFVPGGQPVLTIGDLDGDFRSGLHRTSSLIDKSYARSRARPGDVLLSIKGTIGRVAVVPSWFQGNISRDLARIRPRRGVRAGYVREFMMSPQGQLQLRRAVVGTTRPEISIHVLKRLLIPLPSPDEQKEIDQRLSEAEQWIRAEKTMLAKLRTLKVGLADDLLTGRVRVTELLGNNVA